MPVSRPDVVKSQVGGSARKMTAPKGTDRRAAVPANRRRAPSMANRTPVAVPATPRTTELQATASPGTTASARVSTASQAALVATSVRSPAEKTGPLPARRFSTTRKLMNASSEVQRRAQPATSTPSRTAA